MLVTILAVWSWWDGFLVSGQDMRGACVGCGDLYRKCELSCLISETPPETKEDLRFCLSHCNRTCVMSEEATTCLSCMESCSSVYSDDMRICLQKIDPTTTMTHGTGLDSCSVEASSKMDACSRECYGGDDGYGGWTPDTEEDRPSSNTSFSPEEFRRSRPSSSKADFHSTKFHQATTKESNFKVTGILGLAMVVTGCLIDRYSSPLRGK